MVYIIKMFSRLFSMEKRQNVTRKITFTEDYKRGYNSAWTESIKDFWP
jgi:hypothetical protein